LFAHKLVQCIEEAGAPTCVGLDPHLNRLPAEFTAGLSALNGEAWRLAAADAVRRWSLEVIDALAGRTAAIKPQVAFFEALGAPGFAALHTAVQAARDAGLLVILDAKRGDIGSTAEAYAQATLDPAGMNADAVTLSPYLGPESLTPFAKRCPERGICVLVRTSNPGADVWQLGGQDPIASRVADWLEEQARATGGAVGAVIGATLAAPEVARWRAQMPSTWFLVPGYGAQGASAEDVRAHFRADGTGAIVVSARGVLFGASRPNDVNWKSAIADRANNFRNDLLRVGLG
jgi:orotidine-5'-phosphate decarboxylase